MTLDDRGDTRAALPEFVPFLFLAPAVVLVVVAVLMLANLARMTWVLARRPWTEVTARLEVLPMGTPNGQPVLHLTGVGTTWRLTPATVVWRWERFGRESRLLLAAAPGRGGVLSTPDRRSLAAPRPARSPTPPPAEPATHRARGKTPFQA